MSDLEGDPGVPLWTCEAAKVLDGGAELNALTVGAKFRLKCQGATITPYSKLPQIVFEDESLSYSLAPLALVRSDPNEIELVVTGYKPGSYANKPFELRGEEAKVRVEKLEWTIASVVEKTVDGQPPKPFGPIGPFVIGWPVWLWVGVILVLIFFLATGFRWQRRRLARRRLIASLEAKATALTPYQQFSKELRQVHREMQRQKINEEQRRIAVSTLRGSFRTFVSREFIVPATEWTDGETLRDLKKRYPRLYQEVHASFAQCLKELARAEQASELSSRDVDQIIEMVRALGDQIQQVRGRRK